MRITTDSQSSNGGPVLSEAGWFPKADAAHRVFGTDTQNFDKTYRSKAPPYASRRVGREVHIHVPTVVRACIRAKAGDDADPLMEGDSPGLERYRNAKADLAEMERDRTRRQLFRVADVEPRLMQLMTLLRGAGERIARIYGNEAAGVLVETLDEWERGIRALFEVEHGDGHIQLRNREPDGVDVGEGTERTDGIGDPAANEVGQV